MTGDPAPEHPAPDGPAVSPVAQPIDVKQRIEAALQRRARLEAQCINVTVSGNQIALYGVVHSFGERMAVLEAAHEVPGVARVVDHMHIA